jgi:phage-related protein
MAFEIEYFHDRVRAEIESWPVVVLHAFIKKSQQTPDRELKLSRKRLKELQNG